MNYVLVPIAHGVELSVIGENYALPLIEGVRNRLTDEEKNYFVPIPYNYTVRTNARQSMMFAAVEDGLGNAEARRLKHTVGSDVTWSFIVAKNGGPCFFKDFTTDIAALVERSMQKYPGAKTLFVGHSQGTQNFYSFFFEWPGIADHFISMGSPISMNSGAYEDWGKVPPRLRQWTNLYNDLDFVSSRLEQVHPSKEIASLVKDVKIPLGWNPLFWLPTSKFPRLRLAAGFMAHVEYWKRPEVHDLIANAAKALMREGGIK